MIDEPQMMESPFAAEPQMIDEPQMMESPYDEPHMVESW